MTIWRLRIACWKTKVTNTHTHTHTGCVIIIAFPHQQWLHEHASMLRYMYITYHVLTRRAEDAAHGSS